VLAPLAGVAVWARNQVTNTDRYVRTVAPLASDPAIQQAVTDQITTQIFTYLDVQGLTNQTVDALAEQGVPPQLADRMRGFAGPLADGIQGFVRTEVGKIVQSQAFADAWVQANRVAHQALVKALTGEGDGAVTVQGDTVNLNLAPFIETVKQRLVEGGFGLAARIPEVNEPLLRTGAVTLAALALVFWGQPTGKVILLLAGLLLVALALIEFLGQPPQPTAAPTTRT
jgi:hypothetical protein